MKEFLQFISVMIIFALVAGFSPKAEAADTSDVIAGIIFGGILGSQIEKNKDNSTEYATIVLPNGTLVVPQRDTNQKCYFRLDRDGLPKYATPECFDSGDDNTYWGKKRNNSYYNRHRNYMTPEEHFRHNFPCGSEWGYGCGKLIEKLKDPNFSFK